MIETILIFFCFLIPVLICVAFSTLLERKLLAAIQLRVVQMLFFGTGYYNFCGCDKISIQRSILPIMSNQVCL